MMTRILTRSSQPLGAHRTSIEPSALRRAAGTTVSPAKFFGKVNDDLPPWPMSPGEVAVWLVVWAAVLAFSAGVLAGWCA